MLFAIAKKDYVDRIQFNSNSIKLQNRQTKNAFKMVSI